MKKHNMQKCIINACRQSKQKYTNEEIAVLCIIADKKINKTLINDFMNDIDTDIKEIIDNVVSDTNITTLTKYLENVKYKQITTTDKTYVVFDNRDDQYDFVYNIAQLNYATVIRNNVSMQDIYDFTDTDDIKVYYANIYKDKAEKLLSQSDIEYKNKLVHYCYANDIIDKDEISIPDNKLIDFYILHNAPFGDYQCLSQYRKDFGDEALINYIFDNMLFNVDAYISSVLLDNTYEYIISGFKNSNCEYTIAVNNEIYYIFDMTNSPLVTEV